MDVTIRPARPEEYPAVGELTVRAYVGGGLLPGGASNPYAATLRDAADRAAGATLLVAADGDNAVLGTVTYVAYGAEERYAEIARPGEAEIRMLAVAPWARGRGAGEALVRDCVARATDEGHRGMVLCTQPRMRAARRLYARLGFQRVPARDWRPAPDVRLDVYTLPLPG